MGSSSAYQASTRQAASPCGAPVISQPVGAVLAHKTPRPSGRRHPAFRSLPHLFALFLQAFAVSLAIAAVPLEITALGRQPVSGKRYAASLPISVSFLYFLSRLPVGRAQAGIMPLLCPVSRCKIIF